MWFFFIHKCDTDYIVVLFIEKFSQSPLPDTLPQWENLLEGRV